MRGKEAPVRITISAIALALVTFLAVRPAHALFEAVGWLGYGHVFVSGEDNDTSLGPTVEVGPSFGLPFLALDLTYWTDLDDAGEASQLRVGARAKPPLVPVYGRLALGLPLDGDTRDALGTDIVLGAGWQAFSAALIKLNLELDYHVWTDGDGYHPLEAKVGLAVGF
jgi:hypothetical protein